VCFWLVLKLRLGSLARTAHDFWVL
jgi:hypothetical protein